MTAGSIREGRPALTAEDAVPLTFAAVYDAHFAFVWRSVRRLGVIDSALDDVVQDVFLVVHRKLGGFRGESSIRSWLFAIAARVVRDSRRSLRRKPGHLGGQGRSDDLNGCVDRGPGPHEELAKREAVGILHAVLDGMRREHREVFILAELERMSIPEIAAAVNAKANTVSSRLRAARADFERAIARWRAHDQWRIR